jgi:hypothetical protein
LLPLGVGQVGGVGFAVHRPRSTLTPNFSYQLLDKEAIQADFATDVQRQEDEHIYGVLRPALGEGGPAVVSLNGIVASVAFTELMMEITGIRPAYHSLEYNGRMGRLSIDRDLPLSTVTTARIYMGKAIGLISSAIYGRAGVNVSEA